MTRAQLERIGDYVRALTHRGVTGVGITDALELVTLSKRLHRFYEIACEREQTEREKKAEARLEIKILKLGLEVGAKDVYFQTDPRGLPVYLLFEGDLREGQTAYVCYMQGVAVPMFYGR